MTEAVKRITRTVSEFIASTVVIQTLQNIFCKKQTKKKSKVAVEMRC